MIEHIDYKYSHQLYFFTKEAQNVRDYFSGLLYNTTTTNGHQIKNQYNYDELSTKIAFLTKKSDCYKLINSMVKTDDALKVILALLFKGFSWKNELFNHFNISRKLYVENTLHALQKLNLLVKEKGERLNVYYYEALETSNSLQIKKALHQADMYYITKDFVKFCSLLKELFEFKVARSEPFRFSLREVVSDAKKFQVFYDRIMEEETTLNERKHIADDGTLYVTETLKSKNIKKSVKIALNELKQEKLEAKVKQLETKEAQQLLSNDEHKQLAVIRQAGSSLIIVGEDPQDKALEQFKKNKRATTLYNGREVTGVDVLNEFDKKDKEIEKAPTIIGKPEMASQTSIFDNGMYLSAEARKEFLEDFKPKTAEEEVDDLFVSMGVGLQ